MIIHFLKFYIVQAFECPKAIKELIETKEMVQRIIEQIVHVKKGVLILKDLMWEAFL